MTEEKQVFNDYETFKHDLNEKIVIFGGVASKYLDDPKYSQVVQAAQEAFRYILHDNVLKRFYYDLKGYEEPQPGFFELLSRMRGTKFSDCFDDLSIPDDLENEINTLIAKLKKLTRM
ncbi:MAG: hypothetical protein Q4G68_03425 [Planctomycetia bacterium]|nr:hypothetical protein [Planctomycetia bacterium]